MFSASFDGLSWKRNGKCEGERELSGTKHLQRAKLYGLSGMWHPSSNLSKPMRRGKKCSSSSVHLRLAPKAKEILLGPTQKLIQQQKKTCLQPCTWSEACFSFYQGCTGSEVLYCFSVSLMLSLEVLCGVTVSGRWLWLAVCNALSPFQSLKWTFQPCV